VVRGAAGRTDGGEAVVLSEVRCQAGGQRAFARAADTGHAHHPQRLDDGSTRSHSAE
jgi:hypothetical protein